LINALRDAHDHDPAFGYRLLAGEITADGHVVSERRVWRLCSREDIVSVISKRGRGKGRRPGPAVHDDKVQRVFVANGPNEIWLTDITEHWTREGKLYLSAVKDMFGNKIVGYATGPRMTARLAVAALEDAVARRGNVNGCIVHSDRGSQGVINRSSQHLDREVVDGSTTAGGRQGGSSEAPFAGASEVSEAGRGGVLGRDREGSACRRSCGGCRRGARGRGALVPARWRHGAIRHR